MLPCCVHRRSNRYKFSGCFAGLAVNGSIDAQMGLQWVQENIEHFGGDSNRVTVFGQSSGGTDVRGTSRLWSGGCTMFFAS